MAGRRTYEVAATIRERCRNRLGILPAQGFARQDHCSRVDIARAETGCMIGLVEDLPELEGRTSRFALVGRERHRRLEQGLAVDHEVAAGQVLGHPAQVQP